MQLPTLHKARPLIAVEINGKAGAMLVDTGASMSIIDLGCMKEYGFKQRAKLGGTLTGIGGTQQDVYHTAGLSVAIHGIPLYQFVTMDLSDIRESIRRNTGIRIQGIIGYKQLEAAEISIIAGEGNFKIGY